MPTKRGSKRFHKWTFKTAKNKRGQVKTVFTRYLRPKGRFPQVAHHFKRYGGFEYQTSTAVDPNVVIANNQAFLIAKANDYTVNMQFRFANMYSYTEFKVLYDQYRINKVVVLLFPMFNVNQLAPNANPPTTNSYLNKPIMYVRDYDDETLLTTEEEIMQYNKVKYIKAFKMAKIGITPAVQNVVSQIDDVSTIFAAKPAFKQWLSTEADQVSMYGLKIWVPGVGGGGTSTENVYRYEVKVIYYASFKNSK